MTKDFEVWHGEKSSIHDTKDRPFFYEGEIWWSSLGANIGFEEDGKNDGFERPVVIFKKFNKEVFWGLPVTTQEKSGKYYYGYMHDGKYFAVILSQIRLLDAKRLKRRVHTFSTAEKEALHGKFLKLVR